MSAADVVGVGSQPRSDRGVSDQGARQEDADLEGTDADRHEVEDDDDRQEAMAQESSDPVRPLCQDSVRQPATADY